MKAPIKNDGNRISPAKLLFSKWRAVVPENREKHFLVTGLIRDHQDKIIACKIEAVLTHKEYEIDWRQLKNKSLWLAGWR